MRFMILRKADRDSEAGKLPSGALLEAMGRYMQEMSQAGVLLAGEGLQASSKGARVSFVNGRVQVTDGPFPNPGELVAGFCIIEVPSKAAAIEWVKRWPALDGGGNVSLEIRQVFEAEDFGAAFTEEQRQREEAMRAEAAKRSAPKA